MGTTQAADVACRACQDEAYHRARWEALNEARTAVLKEAARLWMLRRDAEAGAARDAADGLQNNIGIEDVHAKNFERSAAHTCDATTEAQ